MYIHHKSKSCYPIMDNKRNLKIKRDLKDQNYVMTPEENVPS